MVPGRFDRVLVLSALLHAALLLALAQRPPRRLAFPVPEPTAEVDFDLTSRAPPSTPARPATEPVGPPSHPVEPAPSVAPVPLRVTRGARSLPVVPMAVLARVEAPAAPVLTALPEARAPEEVPTPARVNVASLFHGARTDVAEIEAANPGGTASPPPGAVAVERARAASQGYLSQVVADANPLEPSHVHAYYGALARRMRETWRPGFYRTPSMVDTLLAMPRHMAQYQRVYNARASTFGSTGRPDDPAAPLMQTDFQDRSTYSTRTTLTVVEVEQDENGTVMAVRVVRSAGIRDFDNAAMAAVRDAIPQQTPLRIPGGRRSRWEFDVAVSRDAVMPIAGLTFNESNGFFEMNYPGALHVRSRVRPAGSRPLDAPWPPPPVHQDE